jgi:hypothetical protein
MTAPMIGTGGTPLIGGGGTPMVGTADCDCCEVIYDPVECGWCSVAPGAFQAVIGDIEKWEVDGGGALLSLLHSVPGGSFLCDDFRTLGGAYCIWFGPAFTFCLGSLVTHVRPTVIIKIIDGLAYVGWQLMRETLNQWLEDNPGVTDIDGQGFIVQLQIMAEIPATWADCPDIDHSVAFSEYLDGSNTPDDTTFCPATGGVHRVKIPADTYSADAL